MKNCRCVSLAVTTEAPGQVFGEHSKSPRQHETQSRGENLSKPGMATWVKPFLKLSAGNKGAASRQHLRTELPLAVVFQLSSTTGKEKASISSEAVP